jgi:hypothetical protein
MSKATQSLNLTADQVNTLRAMCTLTTYTDGFTYTAAMHKLCKAIADQTPAIERLRTLCRASEEEHVVIYGHHVPRSMQQLAA